MRADPTFLADRALAAGSSPALARVEPAAARAPLASVDAPVEEILAADPAGLFRPSDPATRERCVAAARELAGWSSLPAATVAARAVDLAAGALGREGPDEAAAHVGFHLVGEGRPRLEQAIGARVPARVRLARRLVARRVEIYLGLLAGLTLALVALLFAWQAPWLLALVGALPAAAVAVQVAGTLLDTAHALSGARPSLPRLDLSGGVPARLEALIVVPCLLRTRDEVDRMAAAMADHAARAPGLRVLLLGDLADAPREVMPGDDDLLGYARSAVDRLNGAARRSPRRRFLLLHRPRRFNPAEGVWMGHERKRGKLHDLNQLVLGGDARAFAPSSDAALVRGVAFVITLDADNRLAPGAALRLIETIAHPLNRARLGPGGTRTRAGYGVIQPRVAAARGQRATRYQRWAADDLGPVAMPRRWTHLHQQRLGEASFFGKGIYDVRAFARTTGARFDENAILSHDLLEGCYARTAAIADACVLEESPVDHAGEAKRRHRWMRGDWQNLVWMLRRPGDLTLLSRWKVLDNVRRNLLPACLVTLLVAGFLLARQPAAWTACVLAAPLLPRLIGVGWTVGRQWRRAQVRARSRARRLAVFLAGMARFAAGQGARATFAVAVAPHEGIQAIDAAARGSFRLFVSRRRLLEWVPFSDSARAGTSPLSAAIAMRAQVLGAPGLLALVAAARPAALAAAAPICLAWLGAPLLVWWLARPPRAVAGDDEEAPAEVE